MPTDNLVPAGTTSVIRNFFLRDATTGLALTGKTSADFTGNRSLNGGTQVPLSFAPGSPGDVYSSGKIAEIGGGKYAWHIPDGVFTTQGSSTADLIVSGGITVHFDFQVVGGIDREDSASAGLSDIVTTNTNVITLIASHLLATGVAAGVPTTTTFDSGLLTDNRYNDSLVVFKTGSAINQVRPIVSIVSGIITVDEPFTVAPSPGDTFEILPAHVHPLSQIAAAVEAAIFNEGDATALLATISAKVEEFLINDGDATATLAAIATAVNAAVVAGQVGVDAAAIKVSTAGLGGAAMRGTDGAMLSYTQPTGFLAATFPSDPADQSLIIAATDAIVAQVLASHVTTDALVPATDGTHLVTLADVAHGGAAATLVLSDYSNFTGGGGVIVSSFSAAALDQLVLDDTGELAAGTGSVAKLSQGGGVALTPGDITDIADATATAVQTVSANIPLTAAGTVSGYIGATWEQSFDSMPASAGGTRYVYAIKRNYSDADADAILLISSDIGLEVLNQKTTLPSGVTAGSASLIATVTSPNTELDLVVDANVMALLYPAKYYDGIKYTKADTTTSVLRGSTNVLIRGNTVLG